MFKDVDDDGRLRPAYIISSPLGQMSYKDKAVFHESEHIHLSVTVINLVRLLVLSLK